MNKVYMVVDKTDKWYKKPYRSLHITLEGAQIAAKKYQDEYKEDYVKALVEVKWDELQE